MIIFTLLHHTGVMVQSQTYLDFSNIFSNILKKNYKHDKKKCPWLNSNHVINCVAVIDIKQTILELIFKKKKHFLSNPEPLPESETMSQWASVWQRAEEEVEPPANSPTTTCWSVFMGCTQSPASKIWAWQHNVKIKKKNLVLVSTRRFVYDLWGRPQHSGASRTERKRSSESFAFGAHVNIHCLHGGRGGGGG